MESPEFNPQHGGWAGEAPCVLHLHYKALGFWKFFWDPLRPFLGDGPACISHFIAKCFVHVCVWLALDLTHDCTDLRREVAVL